MPRYHRRNRFIFCVSALLAALAPAPPQQQVQQQIQQPPAPVPADAVLPSLAKVRAEAGTKAYDLAYSYYSQDRIDADKVYRWSRRSREADLVVATDRAGRVAACETHLERMLKLEAKIAKIRRLGFGTSLDVAEVEYYRHEAEFWLTEARTR